MGIEPNQFWEYTYAEFAMKYRGYMKRYTAHQNDIITLAWCTARLSRSTPIPELETLLIKNDPVQKVQTAEQMLAMGKALNAMFGGEFIEVTD